MYECAAPEPNNLEEVAQATADLAVESVCAEYAARDRDLASALAEVDDQICKMPSIGVAIKTLRYVRAVLDGSPALTERDVNQTPTK